MVFYQQIDLPHLTAKEKEGYLNLLGSKPSRFLSPESIEQDHPITWVAFAKNRPIGLISAFSYPNMNEAQVQQWLVLAEFQNQEIELHLMQNMLASLHNQKMKIIEYKFNAWESDALEKSKILKQTGWTTPVVLTQSYYFNPRSFKPNWFLSDQPLLPKNFSIFPWTDATEQDREQAKRWENSNPDLSLYSSTHPTLIFEPLNSLGLRYKDQLAGWMITHRMGPTIIRYSALYVIPEVRGFGPSINLLRNSIHQHIEKEPDTQGVMEINLRFSPRNWLQFIKKRLAPSAIKVHDVLWTYIINQ